MSDAKPVMDWVSAPQACTLPTARRPSRLAEFDGLFAVAVRSADRVHRSRLRLALAPEPRVAARAADLVVRESRCCAFFTFTLVASGAGVTLEIAVPDGHVDVLDALARRASATVAP